MFTVTDALSPATLPAAPLYVGVVSFVRVASAGKVSVTNGAVVSTMNVCAALVPLFPAASLCVAWAV